MKEARLLQESSDAKKSRGRRRPRPGDGQASCLMQVGVQACLAAVSPVRSHVVGVWGFADSEALWLSVRLCSGAVQAGDSAPECTYGVAYLDHAELDT